MGVGSARQRSSDEKLKKEPDGGVQGEGGSVAALKDDTTVALVAEKVDIQAN